MKSNAKQESGQSWSIDDLLGADAPDNDLATATAPPADRAEEAQDIAELDVILARASAQSEQAAKTTNASIASHTVQFSLDTKFKASHEFAIGVGRLGLLPLGCPTVVAAVGGGLKTALALIWGVHMAAGQSWNGESVHESAVLVISMEDDLDEMVRRVHGTVKTQIDPSKHHLVEQRLYIAAVAGVDGRLTKAVHGTSERTKRVAEIIELALSVAASCGVRVGLIVIDHIRMAIGGDLNDSSHATELTRALTHIAQQTGAAVLALSHSPKSSVNPNHSGNHSMADVLGSGAIHDNARQVMLITPLTDAERKKYCLSTEAAKQYAALRIIKSNYSESDRVIYLCKTPVDGLSMIVPAVVTLSSPVREYVAPSSNTDKVLAYLKQTENVGRFTKTKFKTRAGKDGPLGIGIAAAVAALDSLIESGKVVLRQPTPKEIANFDLGRQAKEVLHAVN